MKIAIETKTCTFCGLSKLISEFHKSGSKKYLPTQRMYYRGECKACCKRKYEIGIWKTSDRSEYMKTYGQKPETKRIRKLWAQNNHGRILKNAKKRYQRSKEKLARESREYRINNRERVLKTQSASNKILVVNLADSYVRATLKQQLQKKGYFNIQITPEMIQEKREQIIVRKILTQFKQEVINE